MTLVLEKHVSWTLTCEYDKDEDVLYAWVGDSPRPAVTYETDDGHLIRLDPETKELVGVTIFDFQARWNAGEAIDLNWEVEVEVPTPRWLPFSRPKRVRQGRSERATLRQLQPI